MAVTLKVESDDELRRLTVTGMNSLADLRHRVAQLLPTSGTSMLQWRDDEGDLVALKTDSDFAEAMATVAASPRPLLRLRVKRSAPLPMVPSTSLPEGAKQEDSSVQRREYAGRMLQAKQALATWLQQRHDRAHTARQMDDRRQSSPLVLFQLSEQRCQAEQVLSAMLSQRANGDRAKGRAGRALELESQQHVSTVLSQMLHRRTQRSQVPLRVQRSCAQMLPQQRHHAEQVVSQMLRERTRRNHMTVQGPEQRRRAQQVLSQMLSQRLERLPVVASDRNLGHVQVYCSTCRDEVVGARYKCVLCPNFDLCSRCEARCVHDFHPLLRFRVPVSLQVPWLPTATPTTSVAVSSHQAPGFLYEAKARYLTDMGFEAGAVRRLLVQHGGWVERVVAELVA